MLIFGNCNDRIADQLNLLFKGLQTPAVLPSAEWVWGVHQNQILVWRKIEFTPVICFAHDVRLNDNREIIEVRNQRINELDVAVHFLAATWETLPYSICDDGAHTEFFNRTKERTIKVAPILQLLNNERVDGKHVEQSLRILYPGYDFSGEIIRVFLNGGVVIRGEDQEYADFEQLCRHLIMLKV